MAERERAHSFCFVPGQSSPGDWLRARGSGLGARGQGGKAALLFPTPLCSSGRTEPIRTFPEGKCKHLEFPLTASISLWGNGEHQMHGRCPILSTAPTSNVLPPGIGVVAGHGGGVERKQQQPTTPRKMG